jgi:ATP-binding cassette subfamily B protein
LNNFKVIIAFNRRDYFRQRFDDINRQNYKTAISAGLANNIFMPVYSLFSSIAQLTVLVYGIYLIGVDFSIGLLIAYLSYVTLFYNPLRQLAALWPTSRPLWPHGTGYRRYYQWKTTSLLLII